MEVLDLLEQKILQLIEGKKKDAKKIAELEVQNVQLKEEIQLLKQQGFNSQEREQTKAMISDLIHQIDSLVEKECS